MKKYLQLGTGEWISKEDCEKLIMDFSNSVLEDCPEELEDFPEELEDFPEGLEKA